jgi:transcriptional regulator with AAA-type ATPase domain
LPTEAIRQLLFGSAAQQFIGSVGLLYLHEPNQLPAEMQNDIVNRFVPRVPVLIGCAGDPRFEDSRRLAPELIEATTLVIELLPLRQRMHDLSRFLDVFAGRRPNEKPPLRFSPAAVEVLKSYRWPGNLDELSEVILEVNPPANAEVEPADLPFAVRQSPPIVPERLAPTMPLDELLQRVESRLVRLAFVRAKGNKSKAAEMLGIWRPRLLRRLESLGLDHGEGEA